MTTSVARLETRISVTNFRVNACIHLRTVWEIGACIKASCEGLKRLFEIQTLVRGKIMSQLTSEGSARADVCGIPVNREISRCVCCRMVTLWTSETQILMMSARAQLLAQHINQNFNWAIRIPMPRCGDAYRDSVSSKRRARRSLRGRNAQSHTVSNLRLIGRQVARGGRGRTVRPAADECPKCDGTVACRNRGINGTARGVDHRNGASTLLLRGIYFVPSGVTATPKGKEPPIVPATELLAVSITEIVPECGLVTKTFAPS